MIFNPGKYVLFFLLFSLSVSGSGQTLKDGKLTLNEDGTHYVKFTLLAQVWNRYQKFNPGTTVYGEPQSDGYDIGIRRFRIQFYGQLSDRVFIYSQIGENNFNFLSDRKAGFFVHDALGEYEIVADKFTMGTGLTAWSGLSRFSTPSITSIMGIDVPLFLQSTNDITDQFLRKLSVYAKGKLGRFDYRLTIAHPMAIQKSGFYNPEISSVSTFSAKPPKKQWNGYFQYQFRDSESNKMPYMTGTYLGKKDVFNIGAGFIFQPDAMWHTVSPMDTVTTDLLNVAVDIYYDSPIGNEGKTLSFYGVFTHYDFGPNYTRNLALMNPANGTSDNTLLNGGGNGYPVGGTGNMLYGQLGYKLKDNALWKTSFMPYIATEIGFFERLNDTMVFYDAGINWLLDANTSKLTIAYQNRPLFRTNGDLDGRRGAVLLQYQVYFN
ncbi:hypothetical protein [Fulvivirga sedimenti]|uniref:Porin n=1 Tax=Fulvivirga sedimenti TaxID=2879465 RepID=A0A9X1HUC8_9BACT|nr:hypothetical protein [Fulvivirga sedimenti]MCA6074687.1 hypothetical protein [Fulvivirga sedimenti]MCA6075864.1 hypothetical protein [Fulvivirga sedimenti]MCA6076992.1 hypothetical protein [Fulvivirga sedimenti]